MIEIKGIKLVCSICKNDLEHKKSKIIQCINCYNKFMFNNNTPIMLNLTSKSIKEKETFQNNVKIIIKKIAPLWLLYNLSLTYSAKNKKNMIRLKKLLSKKDKVLIIGGGLNTPGRGINYLGGEFLNNAINLEIENGSIVDVIGDAHQLPFSDESFNCVISEAVLEHTKNSDMVIKEIYRVLKPKGLVYTSVPFLQPVHMYSDFRRFTVMGVEELHNNFKKIYSGVDGGPASSLSWHLAIFLATFFSFNNKRLYSFFYTIFHVLLLPLKYLDFFMSYYNTAYISASGVYFIGRKKENS